ncbi:MAG: peptide chain release factor 3 [Alphaproteobacteria bacterium TMED87]|nr:peptide chain release factor 3 [Rhodospirillaceae bacterium]OUV08630.1 MAG: peptide chain release factor 3 [Alphaproteobacteria bacterium TMED87]
MNKINEEALKRRTFAIISHPDAGKTTLTEKLLLFGGAINLAGAVKAKGERRRARSDWMKVEKERGISVASSVMTYQYSGCTFNLLDTPGHEDFSEDTYRTLTAVDSAIMVIDSAKGIEAQTLKLFEVCRLRDIPIATFINKLDRDGLDPFELIDEIENKLALDVVPVSWPIGMGKHFLGCYDLLRDSLLLMSRSKGDKADDGYLCSSFDDPKLAQMLPETALVKLREDIEMVKGLFPSLDHKNYLNGSTTPVWFGSAVNNFGVSELLNGLTNLAPSPRKQNTNEREISPGEEHVSGFVFKIQANMDPNHRDRVAFFRLSSGHFKKGQKLLHTRLKKKLTIHNPLLFLAQDRETAEEAWPGDIIGIPNHGNLRIGDTLTEGEVIHFKDIPCFAPEILKSVRPKDPMRAKHLGKALQQLAEEGAASVFKPLVGSEWIVGVVGVLQFEVMADRIRTEYGVPVYFENCSLFTARWIFSDNSIILKDFIKKNEISVADDHDSMPVFLARNSWHLDKTIEDFPELEFKKTREQV